MTTHEIVIIGGSYGAIGSAHKLLKALPALEKETSKKFKITMISNSTHFWYSVGAPRAMLQPYPTSNADSFLPLTRGFSQYPSSTFALLFANVTALDTTARTVTYTAKTPSSSPSDTEEPTETLSPSPQTLPYNTLILATGSTGPSPLYSLHGSHLPTLAAYKSLQARLPTAKTILLIGGGSAGTETAGELGHLFGKASANPKEILFYTGAERVLPGLRPAAGARAQAILEKMGVSVVHGVRLSSASELPGGKGWKVELSNGEVKDVDVLIQATGRHPQPSYLPADIEVNAQGQVESDGYLRVNGHPGVWAVGDVSSVSPGGLLFMETMVPCLVQNVQVELKGGEEGGMKAHKPITVKETQLVPVGPGDGVGSLFGWGAPGWLVKQIKGKHYRFFDAESRLMGKR